VDRSNPMLSSILRLGKKAKSRPAVLNNSRSTAHESRESVVESQSSDEDEEVYEPSPAGETVSVEDVLTKSHEPTNKLAPISPRPWPPNPYEAAVKKDELQPAKAVESRLVLVGAKKVEEIAPIETEEIEQIHTALIEILAQKEVGCIVGLPYKAFILTREQDKIYSTLQTKVMFNWKTRLLTESEDPVEENHVIFAVPAATALVRGRSMNNGVLAYTITSLEAMKRSVVSELGKEAARVVLSAVWKDTSEYAGIEYEKLVMAMENAKPLPPGMCAKRKDMVEWWIKTIKRRVDIKVVEFKKAIELSYYIKIFDKSAPLEEPADEAEQFDGELL
jgi:hypothetical protein